ncbi:branched-chain amino acid ABC transporter permease [Ensifer adhaerens]|uniref:branched-chain amino acid ABC transporter permease n=1 Tax=Ensifer adhaerens TaxID=106592 RepID=UPI001CBED0D8|nr:branched-chain amino acid ABC transporter permease [Ensifer adhaerens]MBZ7924246.1 branched-chain amino acid ABC transporter permease [Ensifer adhaerens]UAX96500.1 branched-chain amino acid ABC transporter permease [Ensifer adhaerens]UAY04156.1 branched-chain amino acid ABC transporter permease [Ensifer adhaerens]UAY12142.1 branched-chain amino acid ABC transporter permease [Ensifer adhaerens]
MNSSIFLFLLQDGAINGAIYALLGVTLVLVFTVTRVILVPQGDLVAFAGLTLAALEAGVVPQSVWLLATLAGIATVMDLVQALKERSISKALRATLVNLVPAAIVIGGVFLLTPMHLGSLANMLMCAAIVIPMGPYVYRVVFQPVADASVLLLLIASVGGHLALTALGLAIFGPEGFRSTPLFVGSMKIGALTVTYQSMLVVTTALFLLAALAAFFGRTFVGKALRASAINQRGARLVGVSPRLSGRIAFGMAAAIAVVSGVLIAPMTTLYYDSGFIIGLKGFVAAIIGGLGAYPATVFAAFGVGVLEAFSAFWASAYKEVIVFSSILPILLWRSWRTNPHEEE